MTILTDDELFDLSRKAGCKAHWHDGIVGWAWHCGCTDVRHAHDQQCSVITAKSLRREMAKRAKLTLIQGGKK